MDDVTNTLNVRQLGVQPYEPVWRAMQRFTDHRDEQTVDELWVVEHPPVFTVGQAGGMEHVLAPGDIPVIHVDRGGQVTYHGPGQIVAYPMINLERRNIGVRSMVTLIEQVIIDTLAAYSVEAQRREKAPGVYAADQKVASLGLRVRKGCTFHGLALNVAMDLEPFTRIHPCGFAGMQVTDLRSLGGSDDSSIVSKALIEHFANALNTQPIFAGDQLPAQSENTTEAA